MGDPAATSFYGPAFQQVIDVAAWASRPTAATWQLPFWQFSELRARRKPFGLRRRRWQLFPLVGLVAPEGDKFVKRLERSSTVLVGPRLAATTDDSGKHGSTNAKDRVKRHLFVPLAPGGGLGVSAKLNILNSRRDAKPRERQHHRVKWRE